MLFQTTRGQEALRAQIRQFAEEEIRPQAFLMDQNNEFPEEAIRKLGERGWMGLPYPSEYGGAGLDVMSYAIAVEELARVDGGAGVILSAHVSLGSWPIFAFGTEEISRAAGKRRKNRRIRTDRAECRIRCRRDGNDSDRQRRPLAAQRR